MIMMKMNVMICPKASSGNDYIACLEHLIYLRRSFFFVNHYLPFCIYPLSISARSWTSRLHVRILSAHRFKADGCSVIPTMLFGPWPYRMNVVSMYISLHMAFHTPGLCRITCSPFMKHHSTFFGSFSMECK